MFELALSNGFVSNSFCELDKEDLLSIEGGSWLSNIFEGATVVCGIIAGVCGVVAATAAAPAVAAAATTCAAWWALDAAVTAAGAYITR